MRRVKAIRYTQNGRVFYAAVMTAGDLLKLTKVDVWSSDRSDDDQGYQRAPSRSRKRAIAKYLQQNEIHPVMPTGGLLNARPETDNPGSYGKVLSFEEEHKIGAIAWGWLTLPEEGTPLWIVDMQHRLGGFQCAIEEDMRTDLQSFPLLVTIADGLTKLEEVDQFDILNTTQKKVRTDLARRLKALQVKNDPTRRLQFEQKGKLWEAEGAVIASLLNSRSGVWCGRIIPPNKSKSECPGAVIRETSFVTSLKPVLITPYFRRLTETDAADLLARYWDIICRFYPHASALPDEYVLQKTPGVFSFHMIAPEVFEVARETGSLERKNILEVLKPIIDVYGDEEWQADNPEGFARYGSMKGFSMLASELREELPMLRI